MYLATLVLLIDSVKTKHNINEKNLNSNENSVCHYNLIRIL